MKLLLKIIAVIFVLGALGGGVAFYMTAELPKVANAFFTAAKNGDDATAQSLLSNGFKLSTPYPELKAYLSSHGLDTVTDSSWNNRSFSGSNGKLEGKVTTAKGDMPLSVSFLKSDGKWQIHGLSIPSAGLSTG